MYRGKHFDKNASRFGKAMTLLICCLLLASAAVGTTLAMLVDKSDGIENSFEPGEVSSFVDEPGWSDGSLVKSNVSIINTGNTDAYIRAAIVVTWQDSEGKVYPGSPVRGTDYTLSIGSDWGTKNGDGFYYYNGEVSPQGRTGVLIVSCGPVAGRTPQGYTLHVEVLASAVQSQPAQAVTDAWGVTMG